MPRCGEPSDCRYSELDQSRNKVARNGAVDQFQTDLIRGTYIYVLCFLSFGLGWLSFSLGLCLLFSLFDDPSRRDVIVASTVSLVEVALIDKG